MTRPGRAVSALLPALLLPQAAAAHILSEELLTHYGPFAAGVSHPVLGPDHFLAMFSVGLVSAIMGGRHYWLVPSVFVLSMPVGWLLGSLGVPFPPVEVGIALSVVLLGLVTLAVRRFPVALIYASVALFALFHGYAHGQETPQGIDVLRYAAGFMTGTAAIHVMGLFAGDLIKSHRDSARLFRVLGLAIALAGGWYLVGAVGGLALV